MPRQPVSDLWDVSALSDFVSYSCSSRSSDVTDILGWWGVGVPEPLQQEVIQRKHAARATEKPLSCLSLLQAAGLVTPPLQRISAQRSVAAQLSFVRHREGDFKLLESRTL